MLRFVGPLDLTNNPIHRYYHMQRQYRPGADGVAMGRWVAEGTSGGTSMGYFERAAAPLQGRPPPEVVPPPPLFQGVPRGGVPQPLLFHLGAGGGGAGGGAR